MAKVKEASLVKPGEGGTVGEELAMQVAQGSTIIRLENETQLAIAVQRPRDNKKVLNEALEVLELSSTLAEAAIYSKPVGRDQQTNQMKYAEGLSIRAAEELRRIYGNNSAGTTIIEDRKDDAVIGAAFLDMEKNTRYAEEQVVSKFFKTKEGHIKQIPPDRFADVVLKAHKSKLLREVILRSLPAWLKGEFEAKARELAMKGSLVTLRTKMVQKFTELNVTEAMILGHLGKASLNDVSRENIVTMRGVFNAIRDGEQNIEDVFGKQEQSKPSKEIQPSLIPKQQRQPGEDEDGL